MRNQQNQRWLRTQTSTNVCHLCKVVPQVPQFVNAKLVGAIFCPIHLGISRLDMGWLYELYGTSEQLITWGLPKVWSNVQRLPTDPALSSSAQQSTGRTWGLPCKDMGSWTHSLLNIGGTVVENPIKLNMEFLWFNNGSWWLIVINNG